uniref:Uncharacterized protein n=1 Tax=Spongospora subterranea TaxID=70186 RepID=A0A0H5QHU7_9EUKA|eukprot:CRZ01553.1 hypothetical protein [Spongospora subterranea]
MSSSGTIAAFASPNVISSMDRYALFIRNSRFTGFHYANLHFIPHLLYIRFPAIRLLFLSLHLVLEPFQRDCSLLLQCGVFTTQRVNLRCISTLYEIIVHYSNYSISVRLMKSTLRRRSWQSKRRNNVLIFRFDKTN